MVDVSKYGRSKKDNQELVDALLNEGERKREWMRKEADRLDKLSPEEHRAEILESLRTGNKRTWRTHPFPEPKVQ